MTGIRFTHRSTVAAIKEQTSCSLGDEAVVLSLRAGVYYGLNSVASRVWDLLREPRTVEEILGKLLEEYDIDASSCERDLRALLQELAARELIVIDNDGAA